MCLSTWACVCNVAAWCDRRLLLNLNREKKLDSNVQSSQSHRSILMSRYTQTAYGFFIYIRHSICVVHIVQLYSFATQFSINNNLVDRYTKR